MEAPERRSGELGAILVLALIFMLVGSVIIIPLAGLATTNIMATGPFITERQVQSAADGAMDIAIETVRYSTTQGYPGESTCTPIAPPAINGQNITVDCTSNAITPPESPGESRDVSFVACPSSDATTDCPGHQLLDATVVYSDFAPPPSDQVEIGYSASIVSWTVNSANS